MIISLHVKVDNMSENSQNIYKSVFQMGPSTDHLYRLY